MLKDAIRDCLHCVGDECNDLDTLYDKIISAIKSCMPANYFNTDYKIGAADMKAAILKKLEGR